MKNDFFASALSSPLAPVFSARTSVFACLPMRHYVTVPLYVEMDETYNLACPAPPIHYQYELGQIAITSTHGVINTPWQTKHTKARFFQATTNEVYGDPVAHEAMGLDPMIWHFGKLLKGQL